ncbi:arginine deiminase [Cutibacterium modestum P08]|nr:arginine deiminase [Cutibacterium modestum P08]
MAPPYLSFQRALSGYGWLLSLQKTCAMPNPKSGGCGPSSCVALAMNCAVTCVSIYRSRPARLLVEALVVVAYERNMNINARMEAVGIEVLMILSSELGSSRGGPRCMLCPALRDDVQGTISDSITGMNARVVVAVTALLVVAGCAPSHEGAVPGPAAASATPAPAGAETLADLGFKYGPRNFRLPKGLVVTLRVDHVNNVTLLTEPDTSGKVHDFLADNLSASGFTVTGNADGSLTFVSNRVDTKGWSGAFTSSDEAAGLTLRYS